MYGNILEQIPTETQNLFLNHHLIRSVCYRSLSLWNKVSCCRKRTLETWMRAGELCVGIVVLDNRKPSSVSSQAFLCREGWDGDDKTDISWNNPTLERFRMKLLVEQNPVWHNHKQSWSGEGKENSCMSLGNLSCCQTLRTTIWASQWRKQACSRWRTLTGTLWPHTVNLQPIYIYSIPMAEALSLNTLPPKKIKGCPH